MSMLELLAQKEEWEHFLAYRESLSCGRRGVNWLGSFIAQEEYLPVCRKIQNREPFPLARKAVISKRSTSKKRVVYIYPEREKTVLKLLTWLLLRKYDRLFSENLYSFRPGRTAKDAVRILLRNQGLAGKYTYKADISDYFNSIPVSKLLPLLREVLAGEEALYTFLESLLLEPDILEKGEAHAEEKGIMAGTPLSAFYANLYLRDLDRHFHEQGILYLRYSDDIIVQGDSREEVLAHAGYIRSFLQERGLRINPKKENFWTPEEGWVFLGFFCREGVVDVAPESVKKIKGKMRRKMRALARWQKRGGHSGPQAAAAFIRAFNAKLLEDAGDHELTWARWYFPVIRTTKSLEEIDHYAQECARFLMTGTHTKARFNARYEDLKKLGYRSLVHEYYQELPSGKAPGGGRHQEIL